MFSHYLKVSWMYVALASKPRDIPKVPAGGGHHVMVLLVAEPKILLEARY